MLLLKLKFLLNGLFLVVYLNIYDRILLLFLLYHIIPLFCFIFFLDNRPMPPLVPSGGLDPFPNFVLSFHLLVLDPAPHFPLGKFLQHPVQRLLLGLKIHNALPKQPDLQLEPLVLLKQLPRLVLEIIQFIIQFPDLTIHVLLGDLLVESFHDPLGLPPHLLHLLPHDPEQLFLVHLHPLGYVLVDRVNYLVYPFEILLYHLLVLLQGWLLRYVF